MADIRILPDPQSLAQAVVEQIIGLSKVTIQKYGRFCLALAGGSTPRPVYANLADQNLDWSKIHLFWGDERCVPPEHPDSNYRMARLALIEQIDIPEENIHRISGELPAEQAAAQYEASLRAFFDPQADWPRFDLILLGLGDDGHTASLFPGTPAERVEDRWVTAVVHDQPPEPLVDRVSLTLPAINAARQVIFLVTGASKFVPLRQVFQSDPGAPEALPARRVQPTDGSMVWMIDQAAAK